MSKCKKDAIGYYCCGSKSLLELVLKKLKRGGEVSKKQEKSRNEIEKELKNE